MLQCTNCPENTTTFSAGSSIISKSCVCKSGFVTGHDGTCLECDGGYFNSDPKNKKCQECFFANSLNYGEYPGASTFGECRCGRLTGKYSKSEWNSGKETCGCEYGSTITKSGCYPPSNCNDGFVNTNGDINEKCIACEIGKLHEGGGKQYCTSCDDISNISHPNSGSTSTFFNATISVSDCVCNARYGFDQICTPCTKGTYKHIKGNYRCNSCEAGTYSDHVGTKFCSVCAKGSYSDTGASSCTLCEDQKSTISNQSVNISFCECDKGFEVGTNSTCLACGMGKYKVNVGNNNCMFCPEKTYSNITGIDNFAACTKCPKDSWSPIGSTRQEDCICIYGKMNGICAVNSNCGIGEYSLQGKCIECDYGMYMPIRGSVQCLQCPANSTTTSNASQYLESCKCMPGFENFNNSNPVICSPCEVGQSKSSIGNEMCEDCKKGQYSISADIKCQNCEVGKYSENTMTTMCSSCGNFFTSHIASTSATNCECDIGYTGPIHGDCVACEIGKIKSSWGTSDCTECPIDSYSSTTALSKCESCPHFSETNGVGKTRREDCICIYSSYIDLDGIYQCRADDGCDDGHMRVQGVCNACLPGSYISERGLQACQLCPENSISESMSVDVKDCHCKKGFFGQSGGNCTACTPGKFSGVLGSTVCTSCQEGKYSTRSQDTACVDCAIGKYAMNKASQICIDCVQNSISVKGSSVATDCQCLSGFYKDDNSGTCMLCEAGKSKFHIGNHKCMHCPANTYAPGIGNVNCTACRKYSTSSIGSKSVEACTCTHNALLNSDPSTCFCSNADVVSDVCKTSTEIPFFQLENTFDDLVSACAKTQYFETILDVDTAKKCSSHCATSFMCTLFVFSSQNKCFLGYRSETPSVCLDGNILEIGVTLQGYSKCNVMKTDMLLVPCIASSDVLGGEVLCLPGHYNAFQNKTHSQCHACPVSTYMGNTKKSGCIMCAEGKYTNGKNAQIFPESCICKPGYVTSGNICIQCTAGTYQSSEDKCINCSPGFYSNQSAQTSCSPCHDFATSHVASTSSEDCHCVLNYTANVTYTDKSLGNFYCENKNTMPSFENTHNTYNNRNGQIRQYLESPYANCEVLIETEANVKITVQFISIRVEDKFDYIYVPTSRSKGEDLDVCLHVNEQLANDDISKKIPWYSKNPAVTERDNIPENCDWSNTYTGFYNNIFTPPEKKMPEAITNTGSFKIIHQTDSGVNRAGYQAHWTLHPKQCKPFPIINISTIPTTTTTSITPSTSIINPTTTTTLTTTNIHTTSIQEHTNTPSPLTVLPNNTPETIQTQNNVQTTTSLHTTAFISRSDLTTTSNLISEITTHTPIPTTFQAIADIMTNTSQSATFDTTTPTPVLIVTYSTIISFELDLQVSDWTKEVKEQTKIQLSIMFNVSTEFISEIQITDIPVRRRLLSVTASFTVISLSNIAANNIKNSTTATSLAIAITKATGNNVTVSNVDIVQSNSLDPLSSQKTNNFKILVSETTNNEHSTSNIVFAVLMFAGLLMVILFTMYCYSNNEEKVAYAYQRQYVESNLGLIRQLRSGPQQHYHNMGYANSDDLWIDDNQRSSTYT